MMIIKNKHGSYKLDHITNQWGSFQGSAQLADLDLNELYTRGGVIKDSTGCHAWTRGKMSGWSYGVINLFDNDCKKSYLAHRLVMHVTGQNAYDDPRHVLHSCDKPWCVNPDHLRTGTNKDNADDRVKRGQTTKNHRPPRPTWDHIWFNMAQLMAFRSECVRRQAGCVIIGPDQRIVATGFNGKPGDFPVVGTCDGYCPRTATGGSLDYSDCLFVHGEMNALMYSDRSLRLGGTAYVTSCPCLSCAKALGNSGLRRIVCAVGIEDRDRQPERSIDLMIKSGLFVEIRYAPKIKLPLNTVKAF